MSIIVLDQLTVKYPGRKQPTLEALSLTLTAGETVLLLGASGSGKSTLALTLNGLIPHSVGTITAGRVHVGGADTQETPVGELARQVGIVFQDPEAQFVTLNVEDEILFGLENLCLPPELMAARVRAALDQVGMAAYHRHPVDRLSGGQKQRIALAALLALEPQVLVFDEPTANLDPVGTRDVFALIAEHKRRHQHTIILIEHKLDELIHLVDRVVVLGERGAILADGPPRSVFHHHAADLEAQGVWMPQVCRLAHRLAAQGITLAALPVTLEEAVAELGASSQRPESSGQGPGARDQGSDRFDPRNPPSDPQSLISNPRSPIPDPRSLTPDPQSPTPDLAIYVRALSFDYGRQRILDGISLQVPGGEFLAIVGANGAGKTTLARHLMGILPPPRGTVFVNAHDVSRMTAHELVRQIGYVFQNPEHQFITESVFEEVAYGLRVQGLLEPEIATRSTSMLERFGLARYARANPFTLSHGEKRRLSVATMLAMGQDILILDEPTFGQDQRNAAAMMDLLQALHCEGRTIIMITHDMALVAEYANTVAVLNQGRLLFHGATPQAFAQPDVLEQARLTLPPLAQLGARLGRSDLLTLEAAVAVLRAGHCETLRSGA